jgi:hypothetical protein
MNKWLFTVIAAITIAAIANNFYIFYIKKDYNFTVEASCNSEINTCYVRDCSTGDCPPNNLQEYRVFSLKAVDFDKCTDDSCLQQCTTSEIQCTEIKCGESLEDTCTDLSTK